MENNNSDKFIKIETEIRIFSEKISSIDNDVKKISDIKNDISLLNDKLRILEGSVAKVDNKTLPASTILGAIGIIIAAAGGQYLIHFHYHHLWKVWMIGWA